MKIRTYVLSAAALLLMVSAGTDKACLVEGNHSGDKAPRIETLDAGSEISFANSSGRYTLLQFWVAYDADSRMRNVQIWNKMNQLDSYSIKIISVSLDESESVFSETVKADGLEMTNQVHESLGEKSDVYKKYDLKKGLKNYLIDDKGVIVATNVSPDELSKFM